MADAGGQRFDARTYRIYQPERTVELIKPLMPVMGITRIANVTGLDIIGIPVVMVSRPNSRSISVSQGKGATLAAAMASGLMESVESYHAEHIVMPLILGSYEDLRYTHRLVDPMRLPRLRGGPLGPHTRMLWVEGRDLMNDRSAWVPYELVHLDYTLPLPTGHGCFVATSNGLASGNHPLEAIGHAISETIERDATTLWHLLSADAAAETQVDLDSVDDARCRGLLDAFAAAGVRVGIWETTSDLGIPSFLCRIVQEAAPQYHGYRPASGMGCHLTREIALSRALTEAAQSRLTFISGARDDMHRDDYDEFLDPETHKTWLRQLEPRTTMRRFAHAPSWTCNSLEEALACELDRLAAVGIEEVIAIDLTKAPFGVPVYRVVIPGLEGPDISDRYLPGARARALLDAQGQ